MDKTLRGIVVAGAATLIGCGSESPPEQPGPPIVIGPPVLEKVFPTVQFQQPLYLTAAPGDTQHVFVVTQPGLIHVIDTANIATANVFLDLTARVTDDGGEQGLLGLAFDPDYATNGFFYVNYNPNFDTTHPRRTNISRFHVSGDPLVADAASETVLLSYEQPFSNHKGGWLGFGPDGKLYIAAGDGGGAGDPKGNAQSLSTVLGKILRINKDGTIPADNPFASTPGARGEIWAYGFRNPYRASFDGNTLWTADVGQNAWEEIDVVESGGNYGWPRFEGSHIYDANVADPGNMLAPLFEYGHNAGRCGIIGGDVYRGQQFPELAGTYFFADLCTGEVWGLGLVDGHWQVTVSLQVPGAPTSFGRDAQGELYVTAYTDGNDSIYRMVPGPQ